ncbi:MAG: hypothetical protein L6Q35_00690 [Phycisphaerales bacterium]|nr:hypothetical protein [Phycisphaerales bacterium]
MSFEQTSNYGEQGGSSWVVGGTMTFGASSVINCTTGTVWKANGTQATAIADLTDNSAGTANSTIQAMADLTDSPATADALRDDIVTNLLPAIRNNVADLTAKVNAILAAIRNLGIIASS